MAAELPPFLGALWMNNEHHRLMAEDVPVIVWTAAPDGSVTAMGRRWHSFTGQDEREALGDGWMAALHPEDREGAAEHRRRWQLKGEGPGEVEYRLLRPGGQWRWFVGRSARVTDDSGETTGWVGTYTDIHEQKRAAEQAERIQAVTAALSRALTPEEVAEVIVSQGVAAMGADAGRIMLASEDGKSLELVRSVGYAQEVLESLKRIPMSSPLALAVAARAGRPVWLQGSGATAASATVPLIAGSVVGAMALGFTAARRFSKEDQAFILALGRQCAQALDRARMYEDARREIERRERVEGQLRALTDQLAFDAHHDALTGLPNRVLFNERLSFAIDEAQGSGGALAVLFVDLDRFKHINDTLGHTIGDLLLREVAGRFQACMKPGDTVARMGGDEFTVVVRGPTQPGNPVGTARALLTALDSSFSVSGHDLFVTGSVGISLYPQDGQDAATLQRNADAAMYRAKASGRNRFEHFDPSLAEAAHERLRLENDLRRALERSDLEAYYQPQVEASSGAMVGVEALVRWNHPELGLLTPDRFVSIAEDSGLVAAIGTWMLGEVCRQNVAWQRAGLPMLRAAVNVSATEFGRPDFVQTVAAALETSGLEPAWLELELTEGTVMRDAEEAVGQFSRLRDLGVSTSIDDFGTGYSSLSYLQRLPFDRLKIDRSFVMRMGDDVSSLPLVQAMTMLAHTLGLGVVAEGVETQAQLAKLRELGCDTIQGYLFGRPMKAAAIEAMLLGVTTEKRTGR